MVVCKNLYIFHIFCVILYVFVCVILIIKNTDYDIENALKTLKNIMKSLVHELSGNNSKMANYPKPNEIKPILASIENQYKILYQKIHEFSFLPNHNA